MTKPLTDIFDELYDKAYADGFKSGVELGFIELMKRLGESDATLGVQVLNALGVYFEDDVYDFKNTLAEELSEKYTG